MTITTSAKSRSAKSTTKPATKSVAKSSPAKAQPIKLADRPSGSVPKSVEFQKAIASILAKSKQPVAIASVYEQVTRVLKLSAAQLAVTSDGGELVWRQRTRAAATRLRSSGELLQVGRGSWKAAK